MQSGRGLSASFDDLSLVPVPPATSTYTPVPHEDVVRALLEGASSLQLNVMDTKYTLMRGGRQLFLSITLEGSTTGEYEWSLVGINSYDKKLALRLGGGLITSVCTNLSISGEYYYYHKHTPGVSLMDAAKSVLGQLPRECEALEVAMNNMKRAISIAQGAYFILQWGKEVCLPRKDIYSILHQWEHPTYKEFMPYSNQVYGLYQAATTVCKGWSASRKYPALSLLHSKVGEWEWEQ